MSPKTKTKSMDNSRLMVAEAHTPNCLVRTCSVSRKCLTFCLYVLLCFQLGGCGPSEELFRTTLDGSLGTTSFGLDERAKEVKSLPNGQTEYVFVEEGGCSYAIVADRNGTIVSWRYLSDPKLCTRKLNWGGPW